MTTFQMVISILGIIVSVLTLLGLGVVMKNFWDDKHAEAQASKAEEKEKAKKERQDEIREVIQEEIKPLQDAITDVDKKVGDVQKDVRKLRVSMVTIDRIVMKIALDGYERQGYTSASDRAAWKELYDNYEDLGGNHFKEYVGEWKMRLEALPKKEDVVVEKMTTKK